MAEELQANWLRRLRFTPLRDLFRLRLSGRLDLKHQVRAADLPEEARQLIVRVARRTRLWRLEKIDVAGELIAHFQDGIEAGDSIDALIRHFGDEKSVAKLIRRAKVRNRPLVWQIFRVARLITVPLLVLYVSSVVYFLAGRPTPSIDYVAELNRRDNSAPASDFAWPIYRKALIQLYDRNDRTAEKAFNDLFPSYRDKGDPAKLDAYVRVHGDLLEILREGAKKPALGFIYGRHGSHFDPELWPQYQPRDPVDMIDRALIALLLPHLNELHNAAALLVTDANLALSEQNTARAVDDYRAAWGIADQIVPNDFLVTDLVALRIRNNTLSSIADALQARSDGFTDEQLRDIAHLLAKPNTAAEIISFEGERMAFRDFVQRIYSDDGNGDGHVTKQGIEFLARLGGPFPISQEYVYVSQAAGAPLVASRREVIAEHDRLINMANANLNRAYRDVDWKPYDDRAIEIKTSSALGWKYMLINVTLPNLSRAQSDAEQYLGSRDGVIVAIGLELYRRQHGRYPTSLDELMPSLLPAVPIDRLNGRPLSYRLIDGKPVVYSVGADLDDDGGRPPQINGEVKNNVAFESFKGGTISGDWILFPQPREGK